MTVSSRKRALVLSGGGGRGAYHVGVLRFLEEHEWFPDIVVGTSIGAVNGAAIASGHNSRSLRSLWERLRTKHVQKANLNPFTKNSVLDTGPLRDTLLKEGWVDFGRINSEETAVHLRITATEISTGRLHVFGNTTDIRESEMRREPITLDHIISSCSIPIVYPATQLHNQLYWDGAVVANTPLGPAIDAGAEEIIVVIMTPSDKNPPEPADPPRDLISAASITLEWALLASFWADLKMFRRVNELVQLRNEIRYLRENPTVVDEGGKKTYKVLQEPIIISPPSLIPVEQIISYTADGHRKLFNMGYQNARTAWKDAGRAVEGG